MEQTNLLEHLDHLFASNQISEVEPYLIENISKAISEGQPLLALTLLNELIGYYRSLSKQKESLLITNKAIQLAKAMGFTQTISYATTLLNGATAYRYAHQQTIAFQMYEQTLQLYQTLLPANDYRFASLYNNMSSLYEEMGNNAKALWYLLQALSILNNLPNTEVEQAVTRTNQALLYIKLQEFEIAKDELTTALQLFQQIHQYRTNTDSHFSGTLAAFASYYASIGDNEEAITYYEAALQEIVLHFGKNEAYEMVSSDYQLLLTKKAISATPSTTAPIRGLTLSRLYYEEYGKPMLYNKFRNYYERIAVGLVGHGSECFGYDDALSKDHDFGPGFCLWLTKEDYETIGSELQTSYDELPKEYLGFHARNISAHGDHRIGVHCIETFYEELLQTKFSPTNLVLSNFEEHTLATVSNGEVFFDKLGYFSTIRNSFLAYYDKGTTLRFLANAAAKMAQSGQYNYARSMMRGDAIAANLAISEFVEATIHFAHVINERYVPYYKWQGKSLSTLPKLSSLHPLITKLVSCNNMADAWTTATKHMDVINTLDHKVVLMEEICLLCIIELKRLGYTTTDSLFLEHHAIEILKKG